MHPNNQRILNSQNNIRFSLKPPSKNDGKWSPGQNVREDREISHIHLIQPNLREVETRLNLPEVEQKNTSVKNCFAMDLLQLANSYSKCNIYNNNKFKEKHKADALLYPTSSMTYHHPKFDVSTNSAPETYLKPKRRSIPNRTYSAIVPDVTGNEDQMNFAKSWPLAPIEHHTSAATLPQIYAKNSNDESRPATNSFKGGFAKFNQSREFRMKCSLPLDDANKLINNNYNISKSPNTNENVTQDHCEEGDGIMIETVTDLKITGSCKKLVRVDYKPPRKYSKTDLSSSKESVLTHVTEESAKVHPEVELPDRNDYEDEETKELDRKCIKWLEDVARERNQNPEKVFLPHLLMS